MAKSGEGCESTPQATAKNPQPPIDIATLK